MSLFTDSRYQKFAMSLLTETLNRIRGWVETNYPEISEKLPHGLSISQIHEIVEILPFKLTNESYELYQWSCGTDLEDNYTSDYIFDYIDGGFALHSLEKVVSIALSFENDFDHKVYYLNKPLFPIFKSDMSHLCIIGGIEKQEFSPVVLIDGDCMDMSLRYTSLTSMMLTAAECFETGVLHEEEGYMSNILCYDEEKFSPIYRKYNSDVPEISITNLCQYLSMAQDQPDESSDIFDILEMFSVQLYYLKEYWRNLSLKQFGSKVTEPLFTAATQHEDKEVRIMATSIINEYIQ